MSFLAHLLSRGDLASQQELLATPTTEPADPPANEQDRHQGQAQGGFQLEATSGDDADGGSGVSREGGVASISRRGSAEHRPQAQAGSSPSMSGRFSLASLLGSPHSVAALGRASSLEMLASPSSSSPRHSSGAAHPREAAHSLHLAMQPTATYDLRHHAAPAAPAAHDASSSMAVSPTHPRRWSTATSLVPRHDYIPAPHRAGARPTASPPPSAGKPHHHHTPSMVRAASVPSSPLIPIAPPASFVPPSPPPLTSPYKSILRTAHQTTDDRGVVQQAASPIKAHSAPVIGAHSATSSPHRPPQADSAHSVAMRIDAAADESMPSTQPTEPTVVAAASSGSSIEATQSDHSAGEATTPAVAADVAMAPSAAATDAPKQVSPEPQEFLLGPKRGLRASARTGKEGEEKEERREPLQPALKKRRGSASIDLTSTAADAAAAAAGSLHVRVTLKPAAAASVRVTRHSTSVPPSRDRSPEREEHKAALNPAPMPSVGELTPSRKRTPSLSSLPASTPPHGPHSALAHSSPSVPLSGRKARVRFDRAEIHEFDLVPDASKVPGGDGDYAVGMERTPHTSWIASLDAYEHLRSTQRKADGPEAIEEVDRQKIWIEAQRRAEQWNETQRRKSGLKRLNERQERQLDGAGRKRKHGDDYSESDEEYYSDDPEEYESDAPLDATAADLLMDERDQAGGQGAAGQYQIAPILAPPSPPHGKRTFSDMAASTNAAAAASTHAAAAAAVDHASAPVLGGSRPPSPSSACFRFVQVDQHDDDYDEEDDSRSGDEGEAEARLVGEGWMADVGSAAASTAVGVSPPAGSQSRPPPPPVLPRSHSAPSSSPSGVRLLFSDHADLELIRASRRAAGCNCKGSKQIKVCGPIEDMRTEALIREAKRSTKKGATAGLRGTSAKSAAKANEMAAAAAATEEAEAPVGSSGSGGPGGISDPFDGDAAAAGVEVCPCYAAGIGCNSNICRCTCTSCVNPHERYYFNQRRVNAYRRRVIQPTGTT